MPTQQLSKLIDILTTERLLLLILFTSIAIAIPSYEPDVLLHLTTGRYVLDVGALPHTDIFSYTRFGEPWVMHEWLYQILIYLLHDAFGITAIQIISAAILTAVIYLNKQNCRLAGAAEVTAWFSTILLFTAWLFFVSNRPHIFTYLFVSLLLHFFLRYRYKGEAKPLYFIPVMMIPWVNIHGAFIVGIVLLGYLSVLTFIESHINGNHSSQQKHLAIAFILTLAASLINPYGIEQLFFPFQVMDQWAMRYVTEWMPPDYSHWNYVAYAFMVVFIIASSAWSKTEGRWFNLALAAPFIIASLNSVRHIPIAAFVLAPLLAFSIQQLASHFMQRRHLYPANRAYVTPPLIKASTAELGDVETKLNWLLLGCFFIAASSFYPQINKIKNHHFMQLFPVGATKYLIENKIQGRIFSPIQYSDYILFHRYPEQRIFYDVRIETYGKELSYEYMRMLNAREDWLDLFEKHKIEYIVLGKLKDPYPKFLNNPSFTTLYEDDFSIVLAYGTQDNGGG